MLEYNLCFLGVLLSAALGLIPATIAGKKGYSFALWWFYGWMLFIIAIIHVHFVPNKNSTTNVKDAAKELKTYKELLDCGALTQEEFNRKKEQLLKLM